LPIIRSPSTVAAACGLPQGRGGSSAVGRMARPRTQHDYHHEMKVKPKAATAVIELLMMGGGTPETC